MRGQRYILNEGKTEPANALTKSTGKKNIKSQVRIYGPG